MSTTKDFASFSIDIIDILCGKGVQHQYIQQVFNWIHCNVQQYYYTIESDIEFDSNTIQLFLFLSPCDHDLRASELMIMCGEKSEIINNDSEGFWECRNTTTLKLNIIGCQSVRAKLMANVTVENCTFASPHTAGCQTIHAKFQ